MKNILDKTQAIQNLKYFVESNGKKVIKSFGIENSEVFLYELGSTKKSVEKSISELLDIDITGYTIIDICNMILDNAVELSSEWEYQFKYVYLKKSNRIKFEIYKQNIFEDVTKLNQPNVNNMVNEKEKNKFIIEKEEKEMKKETVSRKKAGYTEEEFNYYEKLYTRGKLSAVEKYRAVDNSNIKSSLKEELGDKFKKKYPKYKDIASKNIWHAFYLKRIYNVKVEKNSIDIDTNVDLDKINDIEEDVVVKQEDIKYIRNQEEYTKNIKTFVKQSGVGTYTMGVVDFIKDVLKSNSFMDRPQLSGGFRKVVNDAKKVINADDTFEYKIDKVIINRTNKKFKSDSAYNKSITLIIDYKFTTAITSTSVDNARYENIFIKSKMVKYNVSFSVDYYLKKKLGKDKYLHTLNIPLDIVADYSISDVELDKLITDNISYIINQSNKKVYGKIEKINNKDYNIVGRIIL